MHINQPSTNYKGNISPVIIKKCCIIANKAPSGLVYLIANLKCAELFQHPRWPFV
uniref:Uncharacterized protein n=1 Tax=Heterorhabditis bacteriophora TaxID=37862 RepID=A0A1I7X002_HETBA